MRTDLQHAADLIERLTPHTTPGPWRDSTVDGNRWGALVSDQMHPDRPFGSGWEWTEGYGGCLVAESVTSGDRRLLAVLRNVADDLARLLRAVAEEDPIAVGAIARQMAASVVTTHTPKEWPV